MYSCDAVRRGNTTVAVVAWCIVVSVVGRINEVNQHRARLVHDG